MDKSGQEKEYELGKLSQDRIKNLMGSDPKFITRLISQLDKQMHQMLKQKQEKQAQIDADMKAIADLDNSIQTHIMPNLQRLRDNIKHKTQLRDTVKKQLEEQTANLKKMHEEARALIQSTRTMTGKLMGKTASQVRGVQFQEAQGPNALEPYCKHLYSET